MIYEAEPLVHYIGEQTHSQDVGVLLVLPCYLEHNVKNVRGREGSIKQTMPEVIILGCIYTLPAYRDLMRAEGPKHISIF